ncbi:MAG: SpoIIE family protein phosphatase [Cyanobacteriota bacterium]|nr:SpoIIE family protein phosphatase [Cyanobacteriota bacterium]
MRSRPRANLPAPTDPHRRRPRPRLRTVLVVPFVLQIFAAVGLTGYFSFRNGQQAVNDLAQQLQQEIATRIEQRLQQYLEIPRALNQINATALELGPLNSNDTASFSRQFWNQRFLFDEGNVSALYFGAQNGEFFGLGFQADGQWKIGRAGQSTNSKFTFIGVSDRGDPTTTLEVGDDYDPRGRPWYTKAVAAGEPAWSEIYADFQEKRLKITLAQPAYNRDNQLLGVVGADFVLSHINTYLESLKIGESGQTFIVERDGTLVATSLPLQPFTVQGEEVKRLKATEVNRPLIQTTAQQLYDRFGNLTQITRPQQFKDQLNGQKHFVLVVPFRGGETLDWLIVAMVPESDFMAQINANTRNTILLCLTALGIAALLGILTSRWIVRPIFELGEASKAVAGGQLGREVKVGGIREIEVLGRSFNQMGQQLQQSFHALEQANSELESRVQERTAELQAANNEIVLLNDRLQAENLRMATELEITRRLQQMILPKPEELIGIVNLDIAGFMEPANEVGGDYYDILQNNGNIKIGIGDVTGHGLESGVLTIMVQTAVRTLLENQETDASKFLDTLNRTIYGNVQRMNSEKNLTLVLLDYHQGQLRLSGQHEEIIIVRARGEVEHIDTIDLGFPIGLESDIGDFIGETTIYLEPNDIVVLYTDGITEAENMGGEFYGLDRLCDLVQCHRDRTASEIQQIAIEDVKQHIGQQTVFDDLTLVILKQK